MDLAFGRQLELAGMSTSMSASDLTRVTVLVPHQMEISNGSLLFDPAECERKEVRNASLLESFTALWKQNDGEILRFASRYGVLELDEANAFYPAEDRKTRDALVGKGEFPATGCEPLARWRSYSRQFAALLAIGAKLHQGESGDPEEWKVLMPPDGLPGVRSVNRQKHYVELFIWESVLHSNLRPALRWSGDRATEPGIVFGFLDTGGLFGALMFRLMLAITKVDGLAICGSCQRSFTPAARARRGNIRFCEDCRKNGSAHRISQRISASRRKALKLR